MNPTKPSQFDVVVIGGGAAGLMCAHLAAARGRRVVVLEGANKVGKKILMSGGGRCNFTNLNTSPEHFLSHNPHFCKSALSRYTQWHFLELVDKHQIAWHEKTLGQLFCDNSSKDIVAMLLKECSEHQVAIHTNSQIRTVTYTNDYEVDSEVGFFKAPTLVLATGGLSIPKMGASDFGYRLARQFEMDVHATRAGLVPFTFTGAFNEMTNRLSGISIDATLSVNDTHFREGVLFTHRGLSGPCALQISSYWQPGETVTANLWPDGDAYTALLEAKQQHAKTTLRNWLAQQLPRALCSELEQLYWVDMAAVPLGEISNDTLKRLSGILQAWRLRPAGTEGYRTAEVTLGGIDTDALSSKTMESKTQPGLFCLGEVVDVTGHLGGFNFQWAWSSAFAVAMAL